MLQSEFSALLEQIGPGVPNTEQYKRMSGLVLDVPESKRLTKMDPFSTIYKEAAMDLYVHLRGRIELDYLPARDEACGGKLPENMWTGLIPWSFRDANMVSEHLFAWAHILSLLNLPRSGSLLEYGPGSGQVLLLAARMGYRACGVDIDGAALASIEAQAAHLQIRIDTEREEFGQGFNGERFDAILFYEAFHHAFNFDSLLTQLHDRLKPGGRIVLCGEPIVSAVCGAVPYPWGPRLDALSVFCIRRFGWMELGFTKDFFLELCEKKGWKVRYHPFRRAGRATAYVLERACESTRVSVADTTSTLIQQTMDGLRDQLAAMEASTSWRLTRPIRASARVLRHVWQHFRHR